MSEAQETAAPPVLEPGAPGPVEVEITIRLSWLDPVALAAKAAEEASRSFGDPADPSEDGWAHYRRTYPWGGPLAADVSELVAGWLADAFQASGEGGDAYELEEVSTSFRLIEEA